MPPAKESKPSTEDERYNTRPLPGDERHRSWLRKIGAEEPASGAGNLEHSIVHPEKESKRSAQDERYNTRPLSGDERYNTRPR